MRNYERPIESLNSLIYEFTCAKEIHNKSLVILLVLEYQYTNHILYTFNFVNMRI